MADTIKNELAAKYEFDGETYAETVTCELVAGALVRPDVMLGKVGTPSEVKVGDVATYYATVTIGASDDGFGEVTLVDTPDENMEFATGTLKINDEVAEVQDISNIVVEFHPNTIITIEYQCLRIS